MKSQYADVCRRLAEQRNTDEGLSVHPPGDVLERLQRLRQKIADSLPAEPDAGTDGAPVRNLGSDPQQDRSEP